MRFSTYIESENWYPLDNYVYFISHTGTLGKYLRLPHKSIEKIFNLPNEVHINMDAYLAKQLCIINLIL